jgi:hypothetical protein
MLGIRAQKGMAERVVQEKMGGQMPTLDLQPSHALDLAMQEGCNRIAWNTGKINRASSVFPSMRANWQSAAMRMAFCISATEKNTEKKSGV